MSPPPSLKQQVLLGLLSLQEAYFARRRKSSHHTLLHTCCKEPCHTLKREVPGAKPTNLLPVLTLARLDKSCALLFMVEPGGHQPNARHVLLLAGVFQRMQRQAQMQPLLPLLSGAGQHTTSASTMARHRFCTG
jgi:hypothetical protein